jgi:glycosyltransferase involved in cell wall biosynthesis
VKALMLHSENSGVGYYRIWQQVPYLRKLGWEIYRQPDSKPDRSIAEWQEESEGADIIIVQRADDPDVVALALAMAELRNCPVVLEMDDNVFDVAASSPSYKDWHPGSPYLELVEIFMREVTAMTVSTPDLANVYSKFNKNISVLRNCQDPALWKNVRQIRRASTRPVIIGWAGSVSHYDDLKIVWRAMKKVLKRHPEIKFKVLGCTPDFLVDHPQVEIVAGVPVGKWPQKLADLQLDIGLAPVVDRPFNRGKSNIKWQEYSMCEIPTIASRVGEYKAIRHRETGFLADDTDAAWESYLEELIGDAELRKRIGKAAKQQVLEDFNIEKNIIQWDAAYKQIIADRLSSQ